MATQWITDLVGTEWTGSGELWLDPEGNNADRCDCTMRIEADSLHYTWSYEDQTKEGSYTFNKIGATWVDSWHQREAVQCVDAPNAWGLFTVTHAYEVADNPAWGWRSKLSARPNGDLVLQMTNVAPWGEEGRAVRIIVQRVKA